MRPGQWGTVITDRGPAVGYVAADGTLWRSVPHVGGWRAADAAEVASFTVDWQRTRSFAHTDAWYEALRRAATPAEREAAQAGIARSHGWGAP